MKLIRFPHAPVLGLLAAFWLLAGQAVAVHGQSAYTNIFDLPLEQLMDMEVGILKTHVTLSESPAAVSVVTSTDIRRSGAMSFPEALRLVPGLEVARVDSSEWAVSARGFNNLFANKLLVLQDGRSIYTPLFSGVLWDVQGTMMENIDRIEVIRGPGATLWGANAVNGVINILTKSARNTQGLLISGGGGTVNRVFGSVRYGGKLGDNAYYRVYGTYLERENFLLPSGQTASNDGSAMWRGGFRVDWDVSDQNLLTLQGDVYYGQVEQLFATYDPLNPPSHFREVPDEMELQGGNLLGRWTHTFSESSELKFQLYYDRTERDAAIIEESRDTFDLDLQHRFGWGSRHELVWGAGYRMTADDIEGTPTISLAPSRRSTQLFNLFVQDEITLVQERLRLTLGSKLEHNDFTGWEIQPGGRLLWTPHDRHTFWASVSRAVRTPSRVDDDVKINQVLRPGAVFAGSPFGVSTLYGNRAIESEELTAYELGYRLQPHDKFSLDLAGFYHVYDELRSVELGPSPTQPMTTPPPPPSLVVPQHFESELYGETYGIEASATWKAASWWRLHPSYTFLQMQLHTRAGSTDTTSEQAERSNPHHQLALRSSMDLAHNVTLDCMVRYVDSLPGLNISSYVTLDVRLAWRPLKNLELAIVGQDLIERRHAEFGPAFVSRQQTEVPRSVYAKVTWHF